MDFNKLLFLLIVSLISCLIFLPPFVYAQISPNLVLGQINNFETGLNRVTPNSAFHLGGVHVDATSDPNHIYVYDSGNNRILGFREYREGSFPADIIFGQASGWEHSACNGDNTHEVLPTAATLCLNRGIYAISQMEEGRFSSMATDSQDNFYVLDQYNNRVLKYNNPFGTGPGAGDAVADAVWGQPDFSSKSCNLGRGFFSPVQNSLCTGEKEWSTPMHAYGGSVDVDLFGNVWVTDIVNSRVLRFPPNSQSADLVLGQPLFNSASSDCSSDAPLNHLCKPNTVKVSSDGTKVYVIDQEQQGAGRVLVFDTPFVNGQTANRLFGKGVTSSAGLNWPRGLTIDPDLPGGVWVNDAGNLRLVLFDGNGTMQKIIGQNTFDNVSYQPTGLDLTFDGRLWFSLGEMGLDIEHNLYVVEDNIHHNIRRFKLPPPNPSVDYLHPINGQFIKPGWNEIANNHLAGPFGLAVYSNQVFVGDGYRILVWNYLQKATGSGADFVIGPTGFNSNPPNAVFPNVALLMNTDPTSNILWVAQDHTILAIKLPIDKSISTQNDPAIVKKISGNSPDTSERVVWADDNSTVDFMAWAVAYDKIDEVLWVSDRYNNRVMRITEPYGLKPKVNLIIGQPDKNSNQCNFEGKTARTLCMPADIELDNFGNLYIAEGAYEGAGNKRILEFDRSNIERSLASGVFSLPVADRVYAKTDFSSDQCPSAGPCNPMAMAFNRNNEMTVLVDAYANPQYQRVFSYKNPLRNTGYVAFDESQNDSLFPIPMGQGGQVAFDDSDSIFILDHTWNRLLVYYNQIPTPTTIPVPGDANGDGHVDGIDYVIWLNHYKTSTNQGSSVGDFNSDGTIDGIDYVIWLNNYGK